MVMGASSSWTDDLPPNVARTYERLCRTSGNLPKPPKRTSLGVVQKTMTSSKIGADDGDGGHQTSVATESDTAAAYHYNSDASAAAAAAGVAVAAIARTERGRINNSNRVQPSQASTRRNRSTTTGSQCTIEDDALTEARERASALERRLAAKLVVHHLGGADRCAMEEVLERRAVESHHADLLAFITSSWERVRIAMSQTRDERRRCEELEQRCHSSDRDCQRLHLQTESQERLIKNLKEVLDANAGALDEVGSLRRELTEEAKKRAAADLEVTKFREERRRYKSRIHELEHAVEAFQSQVDALAMRHKGIVGDLEQSLRLLVMGGSGGSCGLSTIVSPNDPTAAAMSASLVDNAVAATTLATSSSSMVADAERRKVELQFQLQDVVHELQDAKAAVRTLRASIAEDALAKQQMERDAASQKSALEHELARLKKEDGRKSKTIQQLQAELTRHENTARELGRCRGQLAIAERRLESLNASSHHPGPRSESRSPAKRDANLFASGADASCTTTTTASDVSATVAATTRPQRNNSNTSAPASAIPRQRDAEILHRLVQLKQLGDDAATASNRRRSGGHLHSSSISSVEVVNELDDDDDL